MKLLMTIFFISVLSFANEDHFIEEAKSLAKDLKTSLMQNLTEKISKDGLEKAVPFCHGNVKSIAKGAAKDRLKKFEFGRTSHKIRNSENEPQSWVDKYLKEFAGSKKGQVKKDYILHTFENGKRGYLEPLFVEAKCLLCHGENVAKNVSTKIQELYPKDKATGFQLGEFRGFIWIKEK